MCYGAQAGRGSRSSRASLDGQPERVVAELARDTALALRRRGGDRDDPMRRLVAALERGMRRKDGDGLAYGALRVELVVKPNEPHGLLSSAVAGAAAGAPPRS